LLSKTVSFLERRNVDYVVLGGFALPAYGAIRTTADLDVGVRIGTKAEFESFLAAAEKFGFEPAIASFSNPVEVFRDTKSGLEVELWLRPDGVVWDKEMLRRRRRVRIGKTDVWVISPEDFIISKLARPDRGVQDEKDVKSVLVRSESTIDRRYLAERASKAGVSALLLSIDRA
jgi:predicted nucleotidyltransferase